MENSSINVSGTINDIKVDPLVETVVDPRWLFNILSIVDKVIAGITAISIIMNMLTIFVVVSSGLCRKFSYILIANLSLSDALLAFSIFTRSIIFLVPINNPWFHLFDLLRILEYLFNISSIGSLLTIVLMAFELFFMVRYPLKHIRLFKQMSIKTIIFILAFVWVTAFLPTCVYITVISVGLISSYKDIPFQTYGLSINIVALFGFLAILFLYITVLKVLYTNNVRTHQEIRSMKKAAITVCLIVCMYFLFYLPYWISTAIWYSDSSNLPWDYNFVIIYSMLCMFLAINTACDPIIYALRIPKIRECFRKKICCCQNNMV